VWQFSGLNPCERQGASRRFLPLIPAATALPLTESGVVQFKVDADEPLDAVFAHHRTIHSDSQFDVSQHKPFGEPEATVWVRFDYSDVRDGGMVIRAA
jgi:hypothetical protein